LRRDADRYLRAQVDRLGTAAVPAPIIRPQCGHYNRPAVAIPLRPGRDDRIDPHGRAPPSPAVVEGRAEVAQCRAGVQPPAAVELDVDIGVGGALDRQPGARPELPPVEVPERGLIQRARME